MTFDWTTSATTYSTNRIYDDTGTSNVYYGSSPTYVFPITWGRSDFDNCVFTVIKDREIEQESEPGSIEEILDLIKNCKVEAKD